MIILDTSAWIEFFQGSEKGDLVKEYLVKEDVYTCETSFAEIMNWCLKSNLSEKAEEYIEGIKKGSKIISLDEDIILLAGKLNFEMKKSVKNLGMMDSFILAASLSYNLRIVTKDNHFKELENVVII